MTKSTARKSAQVPTESTTQEQATTYLATYASNQARIDKLNAEMDAQIVKIRQKYDAELGQLGAENVELFNKLQGFALINKGLFTVKKSLDMTHGIIGFRTAPPALKTRKGFTWAAVLKLLEDKASQFIRNKPEVDKEALLAQREEPAVVELMAQVGVQVEQAETFYVELKKEGALTAIPGGLKQ